MRKRTIASGCLMVALGLLMACSRAGPGDELVIRVPSGYSGSVEVQFGVAGAPPLQKTGNAYVIIVPPDGKVSTSTAISEAKPVFNDVPAERVWGYSSLIFRTGDGIPVGGSVEFFIGTKDQYQMEVGRKHKSGIIGRHTGAALSALYLAAGTSI